MVESEKYIQPVNLVDVETLRDYDNPMFVFPAHNDAYPMVCVSGQTQNGVLTIFTVPANKNYQLIYMVASLITTDAVRRYGVVAHRKSDDTLKTLLGRLYTANSFPIAMNPTFFTPYTFDEEETLKIYTENANTTITLTAGYYSIDV